ncbi:MAG: hypothetical protein KME35_24155 [Aphanocapsa sp. GSE-SYN-MK-11-07L]|jgi:hypothetical protein|nr:hypothetical protein [Aphanocapsa sp. GSE-SYN-MK-11-07L]
MKSNDVFEALNKFFLDIIGNIIPGMILILGFWLILNQPYTIHNISIIPPKDTSSWIFLIIASYVFGYGVLSVGEILILPFIEFFLRILKQLGFKAWKTRDQIKEDAKNRIDYKLAINQIGKFYNFPESGMEQEFGLWRSLALAITQENNALVYRFTFISLLNLGVATALLIIDFSRILLKAITRNFATMDLVWFLIVAFVSLLYLNKYYEFHRRSMEVPFGLALVKMHSYIGSKTE